MTSQPFEGQKIFVTGAAGFIGSHLVERLLDQGAAVVGIDNFNDFYDPAIKRANLTGPLARAGFELIEGDVRDEAALAGGIAGCDLVVHLAAMPGVRPSMERPVLYEEVNVGGTVKLLEACRLADLRQVVVASSSSIYGNNSKVPFAEGDPVDHPISMYAASKKACELACHTYHALYGLDVTCLRFFTVFGPRQRPDLAIHKFARMMEQGTPLPIFGDGSMERDFTFIDDIIAGVLAAMTTNAGGGYRVINLGSDRPVRLDDLVDAIGAALDLKPVIDRRPAPPCEVKRTWADLSLANELLGYQPRTGLEEGLARFVSWLHEEG